MLPRKDYMLLRGGGGRLKQKKSLTSSSNNKIYPIIIQNQINPKIMTWLMYDEEATHELV